MGLFSKDWAKELDKAEDFLRGGVPVRAFEIAERAERKADAVLRTRAADLKRRADQAVLESVLASADAAEAEGNLEDAADWLLAALERGAGAARRGEIEARRQALLDRLDDASNPLLARRETITVEAGFEDEVESDEGSFAYEMLVSMLGETLQPLYRDRPEAFQQAVLDLNEGRAEDALSALKRLGGDAPADPVLRLERGRANLLAGEPAAARDDFTAAWEGLGEEPLDAGGTQFVPALWAEASLALGDAAAVVERLQTLAAPATGQVEICRLYAAGLLAVGATRDANVYLDEMNRLEPGDAELQSLLAQARLLEEDTAGAIAILERAIAPSCTAGGCKPGAHLPSFRLLARLHLAHSGDLDRARELVARVVNARRGALGPEDLAILADYYRATGDEEAARDAAAEAERLVREGEDAVTALDVDLSPGRRRVL